MKRRKQIQLMGSLFFVLLLAINAQAQPGTVQAQQKISDIQGGFNGDLDDEDYFGVVTGIGDLDGNGVSDIAVGAVQDDDGAYNAGAVYILFLNLDGTVKSHQKISETQGSFGGNLDSGDNFGRSVCSLGDINGDQIVDLAVGACYDDDGDTNQGAVWILFLNPDGTVKAYQKISDTRGGFTGSLGKGDIFGIGVASLGDFDNDGIKDLLVGASGDDDGGTDRGAVYILLLNSNGTVKSHYKISDTQGNFDGTLHNEDRMGIGVTSVGDLDEDGVIDIAIGAYADDDGGNLSGAVWILFLNSDGTVKSHQKISDTQGNFLGEIDDVDHFGASVAGVGDLDDDGILDLAVGSVLDDDGGPNRGAVWILFLNPNGTVKNYQKISSTEGDFSGPLNDDDHFYIVSFLDDFNFDGTPELAVGAALDDDGGYDRGAVWILFLEKNALSVDIDIKPTSCPNPLNVKSKGVLPVSILGSEDLDVTTIDIASIRLADVAPIRSSYEDVAAPVTDTADCACGTDGPDGYCDLNLKFRTQDIVPELGEVNNNDVLQLTLKAVLQNGTLIQGHDCVRIRGSARPFKKADINLNGIVDLADFAILAEQWMQSNIID